jgi:signal transduction histidine kinase/ActR/RegA family two-component response regulator
MEKSFARIRFGRLLSLLLVIILLLSMGCEKSATPNIPPRVVDGVLDLKNWDLVKDGTVDLSGEWEFYWEKHLTPKDFSKSDSPEKTGMMEMPGCWNGYLFEDRPLSGEGYATYRLTIRMHGQKGRFGIKIKEVSTAYTAYVNGEKISFAGIPGKTVDTTIPKIFPKSACFGSKADQIEIILQVSNFHHRLGGPWENIKIGSESAIENIREKNIAYDMLLCGSILFLGIYFLCLFSFRRQDKSPLYFGLFCLLIGIRLLNTGERYFVSLFPEIGWEMVNKIEYLSFYLAVPVFTMFIHSLFHREIAKWVLRLIQFIALSFSLFVLLTPAKIHTYTLYYYQIFTLLCCIYGIFALTLAFYRKRDGARIFIFGFILLFMTIVNDILYARMLTQIGYLTPVGLLIFIYFQSFILSRRFSMAFTTVEKQSQELEKTNEAYRLEIIERQQAEKALRKSQTRFLTVLESIEATVYVADMQTHEILFMNRKMIESFGRDMTGETCWAVFRGETKPCPHCTNDELMDENGKPTGVHVWQDINPITRRWYINHDRAIEWVDGRYVRLQIATDITQLKEMEKKLRQSQKMEAIGTLAGGVAHDLNNILTGIVSYPDLILLDLPKDSHLREPILTIQQSGKKAAAIVNDLLTLARRGLVTKEAIDLNQVVRDYLESPEFHKLKEYHPNVRIEMIFEENISNIMGSSAHLSKVIMNLVSNAAEAMVAGGIISLSTENRSIDKPQIGYDLITEGDYAVLTVSDTGKGIPASDLERIFEPFFSKKRMGRSGTGLGMAVVWGTVKDHDGHIEVKSIEGKGTTFTIYFPVTGIKIVKNQKNLQIEKYIGNGESILVVDDVENQRKMISQILTKLEYAVNSVSSGEEAIDYLRSNSVDLVVLDMIMDPGIDGLDTYKQILELHPNQKAIIVSGFSSTERVKEAQKMGAGPHIMKPYTLEKIGLAVKQELDIQ